MPALTQPFAPEKLLRGDVLSWGDVVPGNTIILGLDFEASGEFINAGEAVASTHGEAV
jgi:hypothetical protein